MANTKEGANKSTPTNLSKYGTYGQPRESTGHIGDRAAGTTWLRVKKDNPHQPSLHSRVQKCLMTPCRTAHIRRIIASNREKWLNNAETLELFGEDFRCSHSDFAVACIVDCSTVVSQMKNKGEP